MNQIEKAGFPLPRRLKEARKLNQLSQKALGIAAGIDEFTASSRMNHYEQGLHAPDFELMSRIGAVLNFPVSYFYTVDDDLAILIVKFHRASPDVRTRILKWFDEIE